LGNKFSLIFLLVVVVMLLFLWWTKPVEGKLTVTPPYLLQMKR